MKTEDTTRKEVVLQKLKAFLFPSNHALELFVFAFALVLVSSIHYLIIMVLYTEPGLVLDDSFIHLQYARTIYEGIPWQYNPGEVSTGCTSPLWAIVLAPVFFLPGGAESAIWGAIVISMIFYTLSTFLVGHISFNYTKSYLWSAIAMGAFVFLPRNTMLMISGMETPLFLFLILLSIVFLDRQEAIYDPLVGISAGLVFLARPEGVIVAAVLVPVRILILGFNKKIDRRRILSLSMMFVWMAVIASFWVLFCLEATGHLLPATFYAKTSGGYTPQQLQVWVNYWTRWFRSNPYLLIGLIGGGAVLWLKGKPHPWLFALSLAAIYAWTLPYFSLINNARYLVPIFDLLVVVSVLTIAFLQQSISSEIKKLGWSLKYPDIEFMIKVIAAILVVLMLTVSVIPAYFNQADLFGREVLDTNDRQIILGLWLKENTPEDAIFAIHDAGALRFYSERRIIDMAGLVSPTITFSNMTRPEKLTYLRNEGCNYFVFFDRIFLANWGFFLRNAYTKIHTVYCPEAILVGNANMSVYLIDWSLTNC